MEHYNMSCYQFKHMTIEDIQIYIRAMYDILYENMDSIAPTGNTYEEDYALWSSCVEPVWREEKRSVILILSDNKLCGFFQYFVNEDTFRMDEIQFKKEYQKSGLFEALYHYLVTVVPLQTKYVDAFTRKENIKAQGILKHLGLEIAGESKNGNSLYFKGEYKNLVELYSVE